MIGMARQHLNVVLMAGTLVLLGLAPSSQAQVPTGPELLQPEETTEAPAPSQPADPAEESAQASGGAVDCQANPEAPECQDADSGSVPTAAQTGGDRLNCEDFNSQQEAQDEFESDRSDPNNLDADNDGEACETFDYGTADTGSSTADSFPVGGIETGFGGTAPGSGPEGGAGEGPLLIVGGALLALMSLTLGGLALRRRPE